MPPTFSHDPADPDLTLHLGHRELLIRDRYETASIINDALIAIEFFIGSFYFFAQDHDPGVWLFVVGSAQLAIRPAIRLSRRVTLRRLESERAGVGSRRSHEDPEDF
ncbi:MAG: YrhK family protein [Pseudonocardia sediminis]